MIKEEFVSFETAKLLKDKEFKAYCYAYYYSRNKEFHTCIDGLLDVEDITNELNATKLGILLAPTQALVCRWLREKYNVYILPEIFQAFDKYKAYWGFTIYNQEVGYLFTSFPHVFDSYEKAIEAGIQYCLKNLIIKKND